MRTIHLFSASTDTYFHHLFRGVMAAGPDIRLSDETGPTGLLLSLAQDLKPDVFLLDWRYQCSDGTQLLSSIKAISPETKTLLFCEVCGQRELAVAIAHGAHGLLLKTSPPDQWLKAVRAVSSGEFWFGRNQMTEMLQNLLHQPEHAAQPDRSAVVLTEREKEVASWVGQGMSNKEIARKLTISDATVKTHLQHIFTKLKVDRRMRILHPSAQLFPARLQMPF